MLFGARIVWRDLVQVQVSDSSKTIINVLNAPQLGAGIHHMADRKNSCSDVSVRSEHICFDNAFALSTIILLSHSEFYVAFHISTSRCGTLC